MSKIVYFEPDVSKHGFILFVKSYRRGGWFRREKIEYTLDVNECRKGILSGAVNLSDTQRIFDRISRDYPDSRISLSIYDDFVRKFIGKRFFVICSWSGNDKVYYSDLDRAGKATYTQDLEDVRCIMAVSSAKETLRTIQQTTRDRVWVACVYLTLRNDLLQPNFIITATGRDTDNTRFFTKLDGNRVRTCATSDAATKFNYENGIKQWQYLLQTNRNFLYAVLPALRDNVNCKNLEAYMRVNKVSRQIALDLKLKWLNLEKKKPDNKKKEENSDEK